MARRTGPGTVTGLEIDRTIAAQARQRLHAMGVRARVLTADGEQGAPQVPPFDRIVCTASVRGIPPAWLRQLRPGGVLVAPVGSPAGHDITVRLTGTGPGAAAGRPVATVEFMRLRGQRSPAPTPTSAGPPTSTRSGGATTRYTPTSTDSACSWGVIAHEG
ncbi:hypothetical protein ABZ951_26300 [Streptomyces sp. NPDC046215]|uniref:Protein-L-isoaspartate O-methyltransferase n=1 Tax=Streptomyces stramineus TaxID=173861 RepID=A0ABN0ZC09_9ACTN